MKNSADPDQLASSQISKLLQKPTDLDLHFFLRKGMWCLASEGLTVQTEKNDRKLSGHPLKKMAIMLASQLENR